MSTKRLLLQFLQPVPDDAWNAALQYWGERVAEGDVERFDSSVPPGTTFILVKGEREQLDAIRRHDDFRRLHSMAAQVFLGGASSSGTTS